MARGGRRRRVLNEELLSGVALSVAVADPGEAGDDDAPRYGEQANVENHPLVSDFIPRRRRVVVAAVSAGVAAAAAAESVVHFAEPIAAALPGVAASELVERVAVGGAAWASAVVLLAAALAARLNFSLRRRRIDDYHGRYRIWRWVAWACVAASLDAVAGVHHLASAAVRGATGWSLTAGGAEWWLAPVALIGGWLFARLALELVESRAALVTMIAASTCYATAAAGALGWTPAALGSWADAIPRALPLVGHTLALAGLLAFARYVVLDVQGLVDHSPRPRTGRRSDLPAEAPAEPPATTAIAARLINATVPLAPAAPAAPAASAPIPAAVAKAPAVLHSSWDDADDESEEEDGPVTRKLSKAEKRRLRKQGRAA